MNNKTIELTEKEIRQINYTLIEMLWELIAEEATKKNKEVYMEEKRKRSIAGDKTYRTYDKKDKNNLYEALGTFQTDYSSIKTGKKIRLTKNMKKAIDCISLKYYKNAEQYTREDPDAIRQWELYIRNILLGNKVIKVNGIENEDVLKWINNGKKSNAEDNNISSRVNDSLKNVVENYYSNAPKKGNTYFVLCIWLSLTMMGEESQYIYNMKIQEVVGAVNAISVKYLEECELANLETEIESLEKEIERWKIVYNYRMLKKGRI